MTERFEKLHELQKRLYKRESPIIIEAGVLLKDTVSDEILIQLKFHSVSNKKIKALKVVINVFDVMGNEIENKVEYTYLDLQISKTSMEAVNVDGLMIYECDNEIFYYDDNGEKISLYKSYEPEMEYINIRGVKLCYEGDRKWIPNDFMYSNSWIYFYEIEDTFKSGEFDYSYTDAKRVNIETGNYETIDYHIISKGFYKLADGRIIIDDYCDLIFDPYNNKLIENAEISNSEKETCIYTTDNKAEI